MTETTAEAHKAPSNSRWPVMPADSNMLGQFYSPLLNHRNRFQPRNGPPIDEWEAALIGKYLVKASAADTTGPEDSEGTVPADSVRGVLMSCVSKNAGAFGQLPPHIIRKIEQIVRDNVRLLKLSRADTLLTGFDAIDIQNLRTSPEYGISPRCR